jgi:hypothetical protein
MNPCRNSRLRFFPAGNTPLADTAVAALVLTRKNACAIVAGKLIVTDTPGEKPKTCVPNVIQAGNLTPLHPVSTIQFP